MAIELFEWDGAEYLRTKADILISMRLCFEEPDDDPGVLAEVFSDIARSPALAELAPGLAESVVRDLQTEKGPTLAAVLAVCQALGVQLHLKPSASDAGICAAELGSLATGR